MADYNTVAAYFPSQSSAESAIVKLKEAGFSQSQLGVAAAGSQGVQDTDAGTHTASTRETQGTAYKTGHTAGSAWEKFKGLFEGNAAEPYAGESTRETFNDNVITPDPDYGTSGYEAEDVHGSLSGLAVPQEHSRYFGHRLGSGEGAIVTVNAPGRDAEARQILEANGGDVGSNAANYNYDENPNPTGNQNIQLYGEVLRVHKDRISRGEVRIRKEVHSTTQTIEVPITREELVVERMPVSGQTTATGAAFQGEEIRIPLSEERATVSKEAVVREEMRVGKKQVSDVETLSEQVRSEELKVDEDTKSTVRSGTR